jgi:hypothetical protein
MALFALFSALTYISSASAAPIGLKLETVLENIGNPDLTNDEHAYLAAELAEFNKSPYVMVADNSDRIHLKYFCVGGKASVVLIGVQGLKCLDTAGNTYNIGFGDARTTAVTGFVADGYVGFNAGVSLLAGVAIYSCDVGQCEIEGGYRSESAGKGVSVNGAYGLFGGLVAYYAKGNSNLSIAMYQAGLAIEISYSRAFVSRSGGD